jgi:hypothetical protein
VRHGLTASFPLLEHESETEFQAFLDAYIDRFQPADAVELDLVQTMAIARWRLRRIAVIESNLFENELALSDDQINEEFDSIADQNRVAWVFNKLAGESKALTLLMRYEASLNRLYERAAKQLKELQSSIPPNEPTGPVTHDLPPTSPNRPDHESAAFSEPDAPPAGPDDRSPSADRSLTRAALYGQILQTAEADPRP